MIDAYHVSTAPRRQSVQPSANPIDCDHVQVLCSWDFIVIIGICLGLLSLSWEVNLARWNPHSHRHRHGNDPNHQCRHHHHCHYRCCQHSSWPPQQGKPVRSWTWLQRLLHVLSSTFLKDLGFWYFCRGDFGKLYFFSLIYKVAVLMQYW